MSEVVKDEKRFKCYLWATWLASALSGDRHCEWAHWYKAHFRFAKLPDNRQGNLDAWRTDHDAAVRARAEVLRSEGWEVFTEGQSKFTVNGITADVGGQCDIVAFRGNDARIDDVKTGKQKPDHAWQVRIYMSLLPRTKAFKDRFAGKNVTGHVVYGSETVKVEIFPEHDAQINARVREIARDTVPATTPSSECKFCDIAACTDRKSADEIEEGQKGDTSDF